MAVRGHHISQSSNLLVLLPNRYKIKKSNEFQNNKV